MGTDLKSAPLSFIASDYFRHFNVSGNCQPDAFVPSQIMLIFT